MNWPAFWKGFWRGASLLPCKHNMQFVRNIYGDEIIERGWKRSLWRCHKCGKLKAMEDLHQ